MKLKSHRRTHKTFLYKKCEKSVSLNNKQRHMKICKGKGNDNEAAAVTILHCDECEYQTTKKYNLKRHKEKHSRIICDECGKSFTSLLKLDELSQHEISVLCHIMSTFDSSSEVPLNVGSVCCNRLLAAVKVP